jgi:putative transposase
VGIGYEAVGLWRHRYGRMFAAGTRKRRIGRMKSSHWQRHIDEMIVPIEGERHSPGRPVDHEGEVMEGFVRTARGTNDSARVPAETGCLRRPPPIAVM